MAGDAGIGKTRLLAELRSASAGRVTWLEGGCLSYGTESPYAPFIEMLRKWIGAEEGEADLAVRTKLRAKLGLLPASQVAGGPPVPRAPAGHPARRRRGRQPAPRSVPRSSPRSFAAPTPPGSARSPRRGRSWSRSRTCTGPIRPRAHWPRISSSSPIPRRSCSSRRRASTRSPRAGSCGRARCWTSSHRASEITLGPLDDDAAEQLLASRPQSKELDTSELAQIVMGAEGNPLYLEELLNAFVEGKGERHSRTITPAYTSAPPHAHAREPAARPDRPPADRAAPAGRRSRRVIGRSFPQRVLEHVAHTEDLEAQLAILLRSDIIRELRRYPEPEYVFRHGLLRQSCLAALPAARRRELYGQVAAAFETLFAGSLDDYLNVLANYYSRSADLEQGARVPRAGRRARRLAGRAAAGGRPVGARREGGGEARGPERGRADPGFGSRS